MPTCECDDVITTGAYFVAVQHFLPADLFFFTARADVLTITDHYMFPIMDLEV